MACQKVCKQGRDDVKVMATHIQLHSSVEKIQGWGFVYLPSLLPHPYLVYILFGMPSLHLFTFVMFCFLVSVIF